MRGGQANDTKMRLTLCGFVMCHHFCVTGLLPGSVISYADMRRCKLIHIACFSTVHEHPPLEGQPCGLAHRNGMLICVHLFMYLRS
jgi:hypothetical protein